MNQHFDTVDELFAYLHSLIDPHDRLNPKYAYVRQQIDALMKAQADFVATQAPRTIRIELYE